MAYLLLLSTLLLQINMLQAKEVQIILDIGAGIKTESYREPFELLLRFDPAPKSDYRQQIEDKTGLVDYLWQGYDSLLIRFKDEFEYHYKQKDEQLIIEIKRRDSKRESAAEKGSQLRRRNHEWIESVADIRRGSYRRGQYRLRRLQDGGDELRLLLDLADSSLQMGHPYAALHYYQKALQISPDHLDVMQMRALILRQIDSRIYLGYEFKRGSDRDKSLGPSLTGRQLLSYSDALDWKLEQKRTVIKNAVDGNGTNTGYDEAYTLLGLIWNHITPNGGVGTISLQLQGSSTGSEMGYHLPYGEGYLQGNVNIGSPLRDLNQEIVFEADRDALHLEWEHQWYSQFYVQFAIRYEEITPSITVDRESQRFYQKLRLRHRPFARLPEMELSYTIEAYQVPQLSQATGSNGTFIPIDYRDSELHTVTLLFDEHLLDYSWLQVQIGLQYERLSGKPGQFLLLQLRHYPLSHLELSMGVQYYDQITQSTINDTLLLNGGVTWWY